MKEKTMTAEILKTEYGITTMKELDAAIKKLGFLDIFPFCGMKDNNQLVKEVSL